MSQENNEMISRLMDDDVGTNVSFKEITNNEEALDTWNRYHLIRDALQQNLSPRIDVELHKRVMNELENEPVVLAPKRKSPSQFVKPLTGFAIAASVMAAVLIGVQTNNVEQQVSPELVASNSASFAPQAPVATNAIRTVSSSSIDTNNANAISEANLNRYLINYNELRANRGVQGMVPYVRIVGYEQEK